MTFIESREKARRIIADAVNRAMEEFHLETGLHICEVKVAIVAHESRLDNGTRIVDRTILQHVVMSSNADDPVAW